MEALTVREVMGVINANVDKNRWTVSWKSPQQNNHTMYARDIMVTEYHRLYSVNFKGDEPFFLPWVDVSTLDTVSGYGRIYSLCPGKAPHKTWWLIENVYKPNFTDYRGAFHEVYWEPEVLIKTGAENSLMALCETMRIGKWVRGQEDLFFAISDGEEISVAGVSYDPSFYEFEYKVRLVRDAEIAKTIHDADNGNLGILMDYVAEKVPDLSEAIMNIKL